mmetsp:Transcript_76624/g.212932  ORF Transcript_76624/g.212932 Transcript_76624/m.212932 type:complete len:852 (+) Transcript_76624:641-3196(+)
MRRVCAGRRLRDVRRRRILVLPAERRRRGRSPMRGRSEHPGHFRFFALRPLRRRAIRGPLLLFLLLFLLAVPARARARNPARNRLGGQGAALPAALDVHPGLGNRRYAPHELPHDTRADEERPLRHVSAERHLRLRPAHALAGKALELGPSGFACGLGGGRPSLGAADWRHGNTVLRQGLFGESPGTFLLVALRGVCPERPHRWRDGGSYSARRDSAPRDGTPSCQTAAIHRHLLAADGRQRTTVLCKSGCGEAAASIAAGASVGTTSVGRTCLGNGPDLGEGCPGAADSGLCPRHCRAAAAWNRWLCGGRALLRVIGNRNRGGLGVGIGGRRLGGLFLGHGATLLCRRGGGLVARGGCSGGIVRCHGFWGLLRSLRCGVGRSRLFRSGRNILFRCHSDLGLLRDVRTGLLRHSCVRSALRVLGQATWRRLGARHRLRSRVCGDCLRRRQTFCCMFCGALRTFGLRRLHSRSRSRLPLRRRRRLRGRRGRRRLALCGRRHVGLDHLLFVALCLCRCRRRRRSGCFGFFLRRCRAFHIALGLFPLAFLLLWLGGGAPQLLLELALEAFAFLAFLLFRVLWVLERLSLATRPVELRQVSDALARLAVPRLHSAILRLLLALLVVHGLPQAQLFRTLLLFALLVQLLLAPLLTGEAGGLVHFLLVPLPLVLFQAPPRLFFLFLALALLALAVLLVLLLLLLRPVLALGGLPRFLLTPPLLPLLLLAFPRLALTLLAFALFTLLPLLLLTSASILLPPPCRERRIVPIVKLRWRRGLLESAAAQIGGRRGCVLQTHLEVRGQGDRGFPDLAVNLLVGDEGPDFRSSVNRQHSPRLWQLGVVLAAAHGHDHLPTVI